MDKLKSESSVKDKMFNLFCTNSQQFSLEDIIWVIMNNYFGDKNTEIIKDIYLRRVNDIK